MRVPLGFDDQESLDELYAFLTGAEPVSGVPENSAGGRLGELLDELKGLVAPERGELETALGVVQSDPAAPARAEPTAPDLMEILQRHTPDMPASGVGADGTPPTPAPAAVAAAMVPEAPVRRGMPTPILTDADADVIVGEED